ncbi:hypothetical protein [Erythrobacter aurantius]|uniref:hypothetical protein n=1 Tax=Erythrobacter aurantius TaxID=2909249 RepID=UPI00207A6588|nr:hypothetical protein [Erythrobacter aurantius]
MNARQLAGLLVLGAALLGAAPAVAQDRPPPLEIPEEMLADYRQYCGDGIPSFAIDVGDPLENLRTSFDTNGQFAVTTVCVDEFKFGLAYEIRSVSEALTFLALREAEPVWSVAEAKWGSDLGKLRADLRNAALSGESETAFRQITSGQTDKVRGAAYELAKIGYFEEALGLLEAEAARLGTERMLLRRRLDFERVLVALASATIISHASGDAEAAAQLGAFIAATPDTNQHLLNAKINRAAFLAESGQYREAVELLEPAYREFRAFQEDARNYKISGSDREFAWILACAHLGLGRTLDAQPYLEIVNSAEETPKDQYLPQTKPSSVIKLRLAACTNDQAEYFKILYSGSFARLTGIWSEVQAPHPSLEFHFRPEWELPEDIRERYLATYRILPDSYADALAGWKNTAATGE